MTIIVFCGLALCSLFSRSSTLFVGGIVFAAMQAIHHIAFERLPADNYSPYYWAAMTFDVAALAVLSLAAKAIRPDWYLIPFSIIIGASIVNNIYGLVLWYGYGEPDSYNFVGNSIYVAVMIVLIWSEARAGLVRLFGNLRDSCGPFVRRVLLDKADHRRLQGRGAGAMQKLPAKR